MESLPHQHPVTTKKTYSEGQSFATKGQSGKQKSNNNNPEYWKDKTCFTCGKKGHGAHSCPKQKGKESQKEEKDNQSPTGSKRSTTGSSNKNKEISKLKKHVALMQKTLSSLEEEDSDMTESEEEDVHLTLNVADKATNNINDATLEELARVTMDAEHLFLNQPRMKARSGLNLRQVILLDTQSTVNLFCNQNLVTDIKESTTTMTVWSTGGKLVVRHKATIPGYKHRVWFSDKGIADILSVKNVRDQYWITYS